MTFKDIWLHTGKWLGISRILKPAEPPLQIDENGLICENGNSASQNQDSDLRNPDSSAISSPESVIQSPVRQIDRQSAVIRPQAAESLEKLQKNFERLIEQLAGINEHLNNQATRHEELMGRIEKLPKVLEGFPAVAESQKQIIDQLFEQLKTSTVRSEQFVDAVEKIPAEAAKQSDTLTGIEHQLAAAADIDVQMAESLNNFNQALEKLNQKTLSQTESIDQMNKTFATSDRYLKYIISQQSRRFMWIFITAIGVCAAVILVLTGIIIYIKK
jgi:chromosome segregation ATPase